MKRQAKTRGAQAVEFALMLPVLVAILSGTLDFAWYLHLKHQLVTCVGQGARAGAATAADAALAPTDTAETVASDIWIETGLPGTPDMDAIQTGVTPNIFITVVGTIDYENHKLIGFLPTPETIVHTAVMRLDEQ